MSTLIENINKTVRIKSDLNDVLRKYGSEGGSQFDEYPERFRELFRLIQVYADEANVGYEEPQKQIESIVAVPVITWKENNVVTITCATDGATIYYLRRGETYNQGWTTYSTKFTISEDTYVEAYAMKNNIRSETNAWANIPYNKGNVPDDPVIERNGTTVTITCATTGARIWWAKSTTMAWGEFQEYTEPVTVLATENVWAYATNVDKQSDHIVFNAATEVAENPPEPVITYIPNTVTITCDDPDATILWRKQGETAWHTYDGPFEISEDGLYYAMSTKNDLYSDIVGPIDCVYVSPAPAVPVLSWNPNILTISCTTSGATIYYKETTSDTWLRYEGPVNITETGYYVAYSYKNGYSSAVSEPILCTVSATKPAAPTMSQYYNRIIVNPATEGSTLYWMRLDENVWHEYSEPFEFYSSGYYVAKATKNGIESDISQVYYFEWTEEGEQGNDKPLVPVISCSDNTVTITCGTDGATIYWKETDDEYWTIYTEPFSIDSTITIHTKAVKNEKESDISAPYVCQYVTAPAAPEITCVNNYVYMSCTTAGATIYYRKQGTTTWIEYNSSFSISETTTYEAKSFKDGFESTVVTVVCTYQSVTPSSFAGMYLTCKMLESGTFIFIGKSNLLYNLNDSEWNTCDGSTLYLSVSTNDVIQFKSNGTADTTAQILQIRSYIENVAVRYTVYGNIASIMYGDDYSSITELWPKLKAYPQRQFGTMFRGSRVTDAGNLYMPMTGFYMAGQYAFEDMFELCGLLTVAPTLPATTLGYYCYRGMFAGCTSLTTAPALPASGNHGYEGCYEGMFEGCTGLVTPPALPLLVAAKRAYRKMFWGCVNLGYAPALPATTIYEQCYEGMFYNCRNIDYAPTLPATTLAEYCYADMFNSCYNLNTVPLLPAESLVTGCYEYMFQDCFNLNSIKALMTSFTPNGETDCTKGWVKNVNAHGTFVKNTNLVNEARGENGIPTQWTVQNA